MSDKLKEYSSGYSINELIYANDIEGFVKGLRQYPRDGAITESDRLVGEIINKIHSLRKPYQEIKKDFGESVTRPATLDAEKVKKLIQEWLIDGYGSPQDLIDEINSGNLGVGNE